MVASAAVLLREYGVGGTSVAKVLDHSGGPRGSVGHHFPGGKIELVSDAVGYAGATVTRVLRRAIEQRTPAVEVFAGICEYYRDQLLATDFRAGCPVGAVGQEAHNDEALSSVVRDVFVEWTSALAEVLVASGHQPAKAAELADMCIAAVEGAVLTARVLHSVGPLDNVERHLTPLLVS